MARQSAAAVVANGAGAPAQSATAGSLDPRSFTYSSALATPPQTLQELTIRQMREDMAAYKYDLDFCNHQLNDPSIELTPPETRTFQIRVFDLGHQIRHCQHRIETIQHEMMHAANGLAAVATANFSAVNGPATVLPTPTSSHRRTVPDTPSMPSASSPGLKRRRTGGGNGVASLDDSEDTSNGGTAVQRLGFWKCRLCTSEKYLSAGPGKQPSAPCKWPLRDVAKMIAHFTELHTEHTPAERCIELGSALEKNRGPFEYWLRRSHSLDVGNGGIIDQCVGNLHAGRLPDVLRKLSRAAANFPNWDYQVDDE